MIMNKLSNVKVGREFEYAGAKYRINLICSNHNAVYCERIDHGTGRGKIGTFHKDWLEQLLNPTTTIS